MEDKVYELDIDPNALKVQALLGESIKTSDIVEEEIKDDYRDFRSLSRRQVLIKLLIVLWEKIIEGKATSGDLQSFIRIYDEVYSKAKKVKEESPFGG
jgi:hypothetical protein